jgi:hypothetical protein
MTKTKTAVISNPELLNKEIPLHEMLISHKKTLGLQSYEFLGDESKERTSQRQEFKKNKLVIPEFEYPLIDPLVIHSVIHELESLINDIDDLDEPDRGIVWDTISYRMAEAYWLLSSKRAVDAYNNGDPKIPRLR